MPEVQVKYKPASPQVRPAPTPPNTSFEASPFARDKGTPSTPFRSSLNAFPPVQDGAFDDYAGFDDSWSSPYPLAGSSNGVPARARSASINGRSRPSLHSPHNSFGSGAHDLENFFGSGDVIDDDFSTVVDKATKRGKARKQSFRQPMPLAKVTNTEYTAGQSQDSRSLLRRPSQPQDMMPPAGFSNQLRDILQNAKAAAGVGQPGLRTNASPASTSTQTPVFQNNFHTFSQSPSMTSVTGSTSSSPSFSDEMLRRVGPTRSYTPQWTPEDFLRHLRTKSASIADKEKARSELELMRAQEKLDAAAALSPAPYSERKALHQLQEQDRKAQLKALEAEKRLAFQRAEAEAKEAKLAKQKELNELYVANKAKIVAAAEAKAKEEADAKAKKEAEEKAKADKEKADKEAHEAKVKAAMEAATAAAEQPTLTEAEFRQLSMYLLHLQAGGGQHPQYQELLKKYYAMGHTDAALMQYLDDLKRAQELKAEAEKLQAQQDEQAAKEKAATEAAAATAAQAKAAEAAAKSAAEQAAHEARAAAVAAAVANMNIRTPGRSPFSDPGLFVNGSPGMPNVGMPSPMLSGGHSPRPLKPLVEAILRQLCENEEDARQAALEAMLNLDSRIDKSRFVEVTLDCSSELRALANSQMRLAASIYPLPSANHSKLQEILSYQLKNVIVHLRLAAVHYGAQAVTHLRFQESHSPESAGLGKITCYIVQMQDFGPTGPAKVTPMDREQPYRDYKKHEIPEGVLRSPVEYEILVERF